MKAENKLLQHTLCQFCFCKKRFSQYCALLNRNVDEQHFKIFSEKCIKMNLTELNCEDVKWTEMAQDKVQC
jgi:hypothetical protein